MGRVSIGIYGLQTLSGKLAAFYFPEAIWLLQGEEELRPPEEKWAPNILWSSPSSRRFLLDFYGYLPPLEVWLVGGIYKEKVYSWESIWPAEGVLAYKRMAQREDVLSYGHKRIFGWSLHKIEKDLYSFLMKKRKEEISYFAPEMFDWILTSGPPRTRIPYVPEIFYIQKRSLPESLLWTHPENYFYSLEEGDLKRYTKLKFPFIALETHSKTSPSLWEKPPFSEEEGKVMKIMIPKGPFSYTKREIPIGRVASGGKERIDQTLTKIHTLRDSYPFKKFLDPLKIRVYRLKVI